MTNQDPRCGEVQKMFLCACGHHVFYAQYWPGDKTAYLTIHLVPKTFWKRVWHAMKYICGKRSAFGDFDEIVLVPLEWMRMRKFLNKALGAGKA